MQGEIDSQLESFNKTVNDIYCRCFPLKIKYVSYKRLQKPWITTAIVKSIKTKSRYFKLFKLGIISDAVNRDYKNRLRTVIRAPKLLYYKNAFINSGGDLKKTWSLINNILSRNPGKKSVKSLLINNVSVVGEMDTANEFCDFFSSIATELSSQIPP